MIRLSELEAVAKGTDGWGRGFHYHPETVLALVRAVRAAMAVDERNRFAELSEEEEALREALKEIEL